MSARSAFLAAFALLLLVYARTIDVPFLSDDTAIVPSCERIDSPSEWFLEPFLGIRVPKGGESRYRPLVAASWSLDHFFFGTDPSGFRLQSLLLHALGAVALAALTVRIARRYAFGRGSALAGFAAGTLFALHPAHPNAVVWIISRADALSTFLVLLSLLLYVRHREGAGRRALAGALAAGLAAALAKETALSLPPLVALADFALRRETCLAVRLRRSVLAGTIFLAPFALYWVARTAVTGGVAPEGVLTLLAGQPLATVAEGLRLEVLARLRLLLLPAHRDLLHSVATAALALGTLAALVPAARRARPAPGALAAGAIALAAFFSLAPSLYIHLDAERHFNARILHLPLAALAMGLGLACAKGGAGLPRAGLLAAVYAAVTFGTNGLWSSAGRTMSAIASGIGEAAQAFPGDRLVVLDAPESEAGVPVFLNAGNFLLAPPVGDGRAVEPATTEEALEFARQPLFEEWRREGLAVVRRAPDGTWRGGRVSRAPHAQGPLRHTPDDPGPWKVEPAAGGFAFGDRGALAAAFTPHGGFVRLRLRIEDLRGTAGPFTLRVREEDGAEFLVSTPVPVSTEEGLEILFALDESADWVFAGEIEELRLDLPPSGSARVRGILLDMAWPEIEVHSPPDDVVATPLSPAFRMRPTSPRGFVVVTFAAAPKPRVFRYAAAWDRASPIAEFTLTDVAWLPVLAALDGSERIGWYATESVDGITVARSRLRWIRRPP